jgi:hypothetical protein
VSKFRGNLTYANVMATLFVFLILAGGTAIAAKQLGKKTVGAKQLKSNAVTTAKIKKAAVTKAKIKDSAIDSTKLADGSVSTTKIADGAVTGAKINSASVPYSQITTRLRAGGPVAYSGGLQQFPLGSYTQQAGVDDQYIASIDITFAASCAPPRQAQAFLLLDSPNPAAPLPQEIVGQAVAVDLAAGGALTRRSDFGTAVGSFSPMSRMAPLAATQHTFTALLLGSSCAAGEVQASNAQVDVISTK